MNTFVGVDGIDESADRAPLTTAARSHAIRRRWPIAVFVTTTALLACAGLASAALVAYDEPQTWSFPVGWAVAALVGTVGGLVVQRLTQGAARTPARHTLIVGSGPLAMAFRDAIAAEPGRHLLGFVDSWDHASPAPCGPILGSLDQLDGILMRSVVDDVIVALPIKSHYDRIQSVIRSCEGAGISCTHSATLFAYSIARHRLHTDASAPVITLAMAPDGVGLFLKRVIDVLAAVVAIVALLPLCAVIAVAVVVTSAGPILFVQERYGYRKRRFRVYKFRTMVRDAEARLPALEALNEATGHAFKIRRDPRLTRIGSVLRRWSLDELPQLWNVLRGDMSLVGPRPMSIRDVSRFSDAWLMRRFSVRPGLTGLWQVSGRCNLTFDEWMALDLRYIDTWSLSLDLRILLRTIPAVLTRSGAV